MPFPEWHLATALPADSFFAPQRFYFVDDAGQELGWVGIEGFTLPAEASSDVYAPGPKLDKANLTLLVPVEGFTLVFVPIRNQAILIRHPGEIRIHYNSPTGPRVGLLRFVHLEVPPLSVEQTLAIRSNPTAAKAARVDFACSNCGDKLLMYAALEKSKRLEAEGYIWYQQVPDSYKCSCGTSALDLKYARTGLHALLGMRLKDNRELSFVPLYENQALTELRNRFHLLLEKAENEEELQVALQQNPVLLHQFAGQKIFHKPAILTEYVADFAILTPQKELLLIEIERQDIRLMKKNGHVAADLTHAFDQVRNWMSVIEDHRIAVLDSLKLDRSEVGLIRGIVIAGRDQGYDALHLRRLKGNDWGRVSFLTFDDLLFALDSLISKVSAT